MKHFIRELVKVKKMILGLGTLVEEQVYSTLQAITSYDKVLAKQIIKKDIEIDEMEVEIEEECLKILALHQPVAVDLRFIVAVIKINNDLERIGDMSVNIAQRVETIANQEQCDFIYDYTIMAEKAKNMLNKSLDSLVNMDIDLAYKVCFLDDEVDEIQVHAYDKIKQAMKDNPKHISYLINLLLISRHLERIADHSTNIAEEVIYLIEGEIIRHGPLPEK
ncbi:PhoU family transcriptional regulator [Candidatus Magnetomorum sp. HK-1]|nr:PhoU family transcriptional regulator [Candidatus Magnetomorum sp. HK-1]